MDRHQIKQMTGWILIASSVFVVWATLQNRYGGGPPLPALVPLFGTGFVLLYLGLQITLCFWFRTKIGLAWIAGGFVLGLIGGTVGESVWSRKSNPNPNPAFEQVLNQHGMSTTEYDWTRHKLVTGGCLAGAAVGLGLARGKL